MGGVRVLQPDDCDDRFTDDGWFRTGDVVTIDARATVSLQDRSKDLIKSGGEWISSVALEYALMGHPAVAEAAVVAVASAKWGERPLAAVVLETRAPPCRPDSCARFSTAVSEVLAAGRLLSSSTRFRAPPRASFRRRS